MFHEIGRRVSFIFVRLHEKLVNVITEGVGRNRAEEHAKEIQCIALIFLKILMHESIGQITLN